MNSTPLVRSVLYYLTDRVIFMPNRKYTVAFKQQVIETMYREHVRYAETAERFGIRHKRVRDWEQIYLAEGPGGFAVERRGRRSPGPPKLPKEVEENLLAEVQRLRAENDYLKKLQALVLEDERHQRRKRR